MASPKISLRGVTKAFGAKQVLRGIDLDVAAAESVVVIGGSGTGKSVLLKCILGLIRPDAGSIKIDGVETVGLGDSGRKEVMRKFGMLFQGGALFDSLTVWENVAFGPIQSDGMAPAKAREVAIAKLGDVGLAPAIGDRDLARLGGRHAVALDRAERDVFPDRERVEQRAALEQHAELAHHFLAAAVAQPHRLDAVDLDRSGVGPDEAQDALQQHRLAGARTADHHDRLGG